MEHMPLFFFILYSIPESIILISLSSALYGYKVRENLYRITLLGITMALVTYIVRALPINMGLNIMIEIPVFIILTYRFLKVSLVRALFFVLTAFIIIILAETTFFPLIASVFHLSLQEIYASMFWRLVTGWIYLLILVSLTLLIVKKNYSLVSVSRFFKPNTLEDKITLLTIGLVLVQATLSGSLNISILLKESHVWPSFNNMVFTRVISFLVFTVPLLSILLVKRLFRLSEQEAIAETQAAFIDNVNKLFTTIRGQRHDFIHHVQVIYSMLNNNENGEAIAYMDNLLDEIQSINNVIRVKDPAMSALFNTKTAIAERHNINFEIKLETSLDELRVKPFEMVKILGNLVDNALEAVQDQSPEFRNVKITFKRFSNVFVIEVFNPRPIIAPASIDKLFEGGYTTKDKHSGVGLAVVKDLVEKNGGEVSIKSNELEGTVFTVVIPLK